jgi:putative colanic acid biosynthesis UDP-glucose lipid carrier transferase
MNYHTNLIPIRSKESSKEKEPFIIHTYIVQRKTYLFLKRVFDFIFSLLFIFTVLSWLVPIVGLLILLDSKGPVFFIQRRMGRNGKLFRCIKFRTMIINDEADEKQAEKNDDRITRIGRLLRKTNMDELPQFINVFAGNMSIIGPRPHMISDCTRFSFVIPSYNFRTLAKPGITGLAQVKGFHGPTVDYESIFNRYHWDAEYIKNAGPWLDTKITVLTFFQSIGNICLLSFSFFRKRSKNSQKIFSEN